MTQNKILQFLFSVLLYESVPMCRSYALLINLYTEDNELRYDTCSVFIY